MPPQAPFEIPEPCAIDKVPLPDGEAIVMRRHGNPDGPRLLISHGNGLAIDMYFPFWGTLLREFDVVVFDLRNHGWNRVGDIYRHNVPQFAKDLDRMQAAVTQRFGEKPTIGVYHSLSALAVSVSESRGTGYAGLFLLDPPFCKPGHTYAEFDEMVEFASRMTRRQATRFQSVEDYVKLLEFNPFRRAVPGAADLAAQSTLRRERDGAFVLRCPREYQAQIVDYLTAFAALVDFDAMCCPVKVLGADPTVRYTYLPSFSLTGILDWDYDFVPEAGHFLFVEDPETCARRVREFAVALGLLSA